MIKPVYNKTRIVYSKRFRNPKIKMPEQLDKKLIIFKILVEKKRVFYGREFNAH